MMWYGQGMTGFGWLVMTIGTLVFWGLLVAAVVLLIRGPGRRGDSGTTRLPRQDGPSNAEHLLAERFARGGIDEDAYTRRVAVLRGTSDPHARG